MEGLFLIPLLFVGYMVYQIKDLIDEGTGPKDKSYDEVDILNYLDNEDNS